MLTTTAGLLDYCRTLVVRTCIDIMLVEILVEVLDDTREEYLETLVHVRIEVLDDTISTVDVL